MPPMALRPCRVLDFLEAFVPCKLDGFVPANLAPRSSSIESRISGLSDAVRMRGVAPRKAPLDAAVTVVGLAVLVRCHAHDLVTAAVRPRNEQPTPQ